MKIQNIILNRIRNIVKECKKELLHFIFPAHCLHCREVAVGARELFCLSCKEWVQRFPLNECLPFKAVAVEKEGVALSLLREVKGPCHPEAISTMAALMAFQIIDLKWPFPDLLIPSTKDPINLLLAKELSIFFQAPVKKWLKTENRWKRPGLCCDKNILIVELMTSFSESWDIIEEAAPLQVFQIGFCKLNSF